MKFIPFLTVLALCALSPYIVQAQENHAIPTQLDVNRQTCSETSKAEAELQDMYKKIQKKYATDKAFLQALEASQKAWVAYRDSQINMQYLPEHIMEYYGSRNTVCRCSMETTMAKNRIKELQPWLDGSGANGSTCFGNIAAP